MTFVLHHRKMASRDKAGSSKRRNKRVLLLDGGLATELERRGHDISDDPLWSARLLHSDPEAILEVHKSYLEAGADILITASYQASVGGFCKELGISESEALNLIGRSVDLAREAIRQYKTSSQYVDREILIAGSIGPYGACQHDGSEYTGVYVDHMTKQELKKWHRERMRCLVDRGVDLLAIETIPAVIEGVALVELMRRDFPSSRAWISFSCKNGMETCHGEVFNEAVRAVLEARGGGGGRGGGQIVAVGANCCDPSFIESLLGSYSQNRAVPGSVVYPNSGEIWDGNNHCWTGETTSSISSLTTRWMDIGATIVGGCCRVGPDTIRLLRHTIDLFNVQNTA